MRRIITFIAAVLTVISADCRDFDFKKGINISHWLSQTPDFGEVRKNKFTREDVKFIAECGFDHIRIPIDESHMFDENINPYPEAFELLHNALGWCKEFGLKAVVDLHVIRSHNFGASYRPLFTDVREQEQFYQCWRILSSELKKYPRKMVAYELMNEPVADDPEIWNIIVNRCLEEVRKLEPKRKVIIGSNSWQTYETVKYLRVPEDDKNVVISFHYYNPYPFTHYRTSWTGEWDNPLKKVSYPGYLATKEEVAELTPEMKEKYGWLCEEKGYYDINVLEKEILVGLEPIRKMGKDAYLGEFGVINYMDREMTEQWYRDFCTVCEKLGLAYAAWDYKGAFSIFKDGKPWTEKIKAITRK